MKKILKNKKGFSLIEMLVSMALLTVVMMISINVLTIVGKTARKVDFQVNVTQESSFAAERMKRVIRSADSVVFVSNDRVRAFVEGNWIDFEFVDVGGKYVLKETTGTGATMTTQSIMSSDVIVKRFGSTDFVTSITEGADDVGVRITFQAFNIDDSEETAGAIVSTQAINRSIILNQ